MVFARAREMRMGVVVSVNPVKRAAMIIADLKTTLYGRQQFSQDFGRYFVIACLNSVFMFALYQLFYWFNPVESFTGEVAWFFSFILGTIEAHYVHRRFTFKSTASYGESLYWVIFVYSIILVLSTLTISTLIRTFEIQYQLAWVINNCLFGLVYFAGLRLLAFPPEVPSEA